MCSSDLVVPLRDSRGVIGTLSVTRDDGHRFDAEEVAILTEFGSQAALAVPAWCTHPSVWSTAASCPS